MTFDESGRADAAFSTFSASCFGKFENGCVRLEQEVRVSVGVNRE